MQSLFSLGNSEQEDSLIFQVKQSLDFHIDRFSQYIWKGVRDLVKKLFTSDKKGSVSSDYEQISQVKFLSHLFTHRKFMQKWIRSSEKTSKDTRFPLILGMILKLSLKILCLKQWRLAMESI